MTLPVFILVAVILPIALVAAIWALVRYAIWEALRPRTSGVIQAVLGLIYLIVFWFIEPRTGTRLIVPTILGAGFIGWESTTGFVASRNTSSKPGSPSRPASWHCRRGVLAQVFPARRETTRSR
jgi:hypothetical protein